MQKMWIKPQLHNQFGGPYYETYLKNKTHYILKSITNQKQGQLKDCKN